MQNAANSHAGVLQAILPETSASHLPGESMAEAALVVLWWAQQTCFLQTVTLSLLEIADSYMLSTVVSALHMLTHFIHTTL